MMSAPAERYIPTPPPIPTLTPEQARAKCCPLISGRDPKTNTIKREQCVASDCALWEWWLPPSGSFCGIGFCSIPKVIEQGKRKCE